MRIPWKSARIAILNLGMIFPALASGGARPTPKGLLFYAKYAYEDDTVAIRNPYILGPLFQIYWSEVEKSQGIFDWGAIDKRIAVWKKAGKKSALRILWITSGSWPDPSAKHPTPAWVWDAGAVKVTDPDKGTEIPLFWDPIYRRHALAFLRETSRRFDADTSVLLLDMTPGAETNPYRFGISNDKDSSLQTQYLNTKASDGRVYDAELWLSTVERFVDSAAGYFKNTPLLVTLNTGGMPGSGSRQKLIGDYCVGAGTWVGQNGLGGNSYASPSQVKTQFLDWSARSRVFFETLSSTADARVGTLMEVMQAAERVKAGYINIYPTDVWKGTAGHPSYDPEYEKALRYGYAMLQGPTALEPKRITVGGLPRAPGFLHKGIDILGRLLKRGEHR